MHMKNIPLRRFRVALLLAGTWAAVGFGQTGGPEDNLVRQFFPQWLITEANADFARGGPPPFQAFAFADADLDGTGALDFIVAAYSNGFSGAVVVLRKQGTSAVQVAAPSFPLMGGIYPNVTMLDVDNDGRPEAIVSFSSARGSGADWILKWNGTTLQSIGPTSVDRRGNIATLLSEAEFIDLTRDGVLDAISAPQSGPLSDGIPVAGILSVFSLANGVYRQSSITFNIFATFLRSTGEPVAAVRRFSVGNPSGQYVMTIVNGDRRGGHRVSSAEITLNRVVVARPQLFNQQVRRLRIPVTVSTSNVLSVALRSAPGSQLSIGIGPQ